MSRTKGIWRWALMSVVATMVAGPVSANLINDPPSVTTNTSAGLLIYPKIIVDSSRGIDTYIQLTNTASFLTRVHCFYVNANGHCSNDPGTVCTPENFRSVCASPGTCSPGWQEVDFRLTLTKRQPIAWNASEGRSAFPLPPVIGEDPSAQSNKDSIVPPVNEDPFIGELRCVQVDVSSEEPIARNDLKGESTQVLASAGVVDAAKYTAIGIPAIDGAQDGDPNTLNIGGPAAEYNGCPNILTLNNYFEGANITTHGNAETTTVTSRLTVVPCAADFLNQAPASATLQFLIYNEFEQRFSSSTHVTCYKDVALSDIDTRPGPDGDSSSIFAAGVQGTLTGQTRIRSVSSASADGYSGKGVLAVVQEFWSASGIGTVSSEANVQYSGTRADGDRMVIPLP